MRTPVHNHLDNEVIRSEVTNQRLRGSRRRRRIFELTMSALGRIAPRPRYGSPRGVADLVRPIGMRSAD
jgi:hypothetical protein